MKSGRQSGITLVALIITIIVMLILVAVTVAILINSNIIGKAKDATGRTEAKYAEEANFGEKITIGETEYNSIDEYLALREDENTVQSLAKAGTIKRWDKIDYNPGTRTTASIELPAGASIEGTKIAAINLPAGATLGGTISASSATDWIVLDVNQTTGEVLIMPTTVSNTTLTLSGIDGYNNALTALQAVADIYLNPAQGASVRSLTVEDVNKVENQMPNGTVAEYTWNCRYGMDSNLNITDTGSDSDTPSQTFASSTTTGYYGYDLSAMSASGDAWLGTRFVDIRQGTASFLVGHLWISHGCCAGAWLAHALGSTSLTETTGSKVVLPVVTLKADIQIENTGTYTEVATGTATATATATGSLAEKLGEHNVWTIK